MGREKWSDGGETATDPTGFWSIRVVRMEEERSVGRGWIGLHMA